MSFTSIVPDRRHRVDQDSKAARSSVRAGGLASLRTSLRVAFGTSGPVRLADLVLRIRSIYRHPARMGDKAKPPLDVDQCEVVAPAQLT